MDKVINKIDKQKDLTLKQRNWLKAYIETGNATEAAMRVYDCKDRDVARNIGSENLSKLGMDELMEEMGLTDVALTNMIAEGATKANKIHGTQDSYIEVPDYATRHKYIETGLKLKKRLGNETQAQVTNNNNVIIMPSELIQKYNLQEGEVIDAVPSDTSPGSN